MKKAHLLTAVIILICSQTINAQFSAGLKTAVIINDVEVNSGALDLNKLVKPITGFAIGGSLSHDINSNLALQSELLYKHTGFKISEGTSINIAGFEVPVGATIKTSINYLELPILLKYKMNIGSIGGYIQAGPSLNYAMNGKIRTVANSIIDFNINTIDLNLAGDAYNRFGIGANIGAGLEFPTSANSFISTEVRYSRDMNSQVEVPVIKAGVRNSGFSIAIGVHQRF